MSSGTMKRAALIQDFNGNPVRFLPKGFVLNDKRWERSWRVYERKGAPLTSDNLRWLFGDDLAGPVDSMYW